MDRYQMSRPGFRPNNMASAGNARMAAQRPCGCEKKESIYHHVDQMPLTMAYVPMQRFGTTMELSRALCVGTIFPELCKPFVGKRGKRC